MMRRLLATLVLLSVIPAAQAAPAPGPDPAIAAVVASVSAAQLKAYDTRLVGFGTRNTFSEKLGEKRGVFAARSWIADQFREFARASHGRMTVAYARMSRRPTASASCATWRSPASSPR